MTIRLHNATDFKKLLMSKGYTIRSFAEVTGLSHSHISLIVNGERNPSPAAAKKIAEALNVTFDDIFFVKVDY